MREPGQPTFTAMEAGTNRYATRPPSSLERIFNHIWRNSILHWARASNYNKSLHPTMQSFNNIWMKHGIIFFFISLGNLYFITKLTWYEFYHINIPEQWIWRENAIMVSNYLDWLHGWTFNQWKKKVHSRTLHDVFCECTCAYHNWCGRGNVAWYHFCNLSLTK